MNTKKVQSENLGGETNTTIPNSVMMGSPGSGVPANEDVEAELEALSWVVRQPASERRCGLIPNRSAISTWSAG